ncbi:hypothetical protein T03_17801 [Trichinella britovi]|uniref:HTH OST-type domain-containing protein n=2 Tax=Trichinella TaxID=6333 RepID=A0A0V1CF13_TRIBR|nr:hypothetical protein T05_16423 [Trichinella murrelli]KRY47736.1 hypothetical protein T03_17801 [Trichinella britovi]
MTLLDPLHERVYAVLKSFPSGATEPEFISEFKFYIQYDVPFESYGFASLKDFIASAPNLYEIKCNIDGEVLYRAITNDSFCLYDSLMPIRQPQHDKRNKEYCFDYAPPIEKANSASSSISSEGTIAKTETNVK